MWFLCDNEEEQEVIESDEYPKTISAGGKWTSISAGHKTKEDLWEKEKILEKPCVVCGKWVSTCYHGNERMISKNMCFSCNLWDERSEIIKNRNNIMIVNGCMYSISPNENDAGYKGFGGRKFIFQVIETGEIKQSGNVWYGGEIPKQFKERIPDNAIMIEGYGPTKMI